MYRVQCCSYNGHLGSGTSPSDPDISSWLHPTLSSATASSATTSATSLPDVFAIGFQEMIPLHLSLLGLTATALDLHDHELKAAIELHANEVAGGGETYTLMAKKALGGIVLLVYTRDRTITDSVVDVRIATAGTGIFNLMGNKGAVGVRLTLDDDVEDEKDARDKEDTGNTVMTFVTAHLAAHESGLQRRNENWKSIVERLVFSPEGASEHHQPKRSKDVFGKLKNKVKKSLYDEGEGIQIYDTSYLFFFGDLNYRISPTTPKPIPLHLIAHKISNDIPALLAHDQLTQEHSASRTLHHLKEAPISFRPTYKYIIGTVDEFKKFTSRVPGWCDRILYATWADQEEGKSSGATVDLYTSIPSFTRSDHKPVTAIISLPSTPSGSRALRLPFSAPFAIDPLWRRKQFLGWLLDRLVGFWWTLIMLAGLGKDARLGVSTLGSAAFAAWWYRSLLFGL